MHGEASHPRRAPRRVREGRGQQAPVPGRRHEANRPDSRCPAEDQTGGLGEAGAFPVGDYDPDSIMNYCRLNADLEQNRATELSAGDVATLLQYYGHALAFPTADLGV